MALCYQFNGAVFTLVIIFSSGVLLAEAQSTKPDNPGEANTATEPSNNESDTVRWMDTFFHAHHFEGQYTFNNVSSWFQFVIQYKHPNDPRTLVTRYYDASGADLEFNGTSVDGHVIVFTLSKTYIQGMRFPLQQPLEVTGSFARTDQPYFTGNITKPINSSFSSFRMNKDTRSCKYNGKVYMHGDTFKDKEDCNTCTCIQNEDIMCTMMYCYPGLKIETGKTAGTMTAIVIIIPTSIAFLGICFCWASKKGYLRGWHKSCRQTSYESEAETIHV